MYLFRVALSSGDESIDKAPQVVKGLPTYLTINEGEPVTLECSFVGRPEPSIAWYKDKAPLLSSAYVDVSLVPLHSNFPLRKGTL